MFWSVLDNAGSSTAVSAVISLMFFWIPITLSILVRFRWKIAGFTPRNKDSKMTSSRTCDFALSMEILTLEHSMRQRQYLPQFLVFWCSVDMSGKNYFRASIATAEVSLYLSYLLRYSRWKIAVGAVGGGLFQKGRMRPGSYISVSKFHKCVTRT